MAIRVISSGTTIVKRITVGTPTRIGDVFNGNLIELNDVNTTNLSNGGYLRYDSSTEEFKFITLDTALNESDARQVIRSHFSAAGDLLYDSSAGVFSIDIAEGYTTTNFESDLAEAINLGPGLSYTIGPGIFGNNILAIDSTGVIAGVYGSQSQIPIISVNVRGQIDSISTIAVAGVTNFVYDSASGLLSISTADGNTFSDSINLAAFTTSTLAEGSNLYYTTARADSDAKNAISSGGNGISYNNTTGEISIDSSSSVTVNNLNVQQNVLISGNLTVNGDTTTVNSVTVTINDKNLVLADSAADSAQADGAGLTINGANATITYVAATNTFDFNKAFGTGTNVLSNYTTSQLAEGSNLYYTRDRADSAARYALGVIDNGGDGSLTYSAFTGNFTYTGPSAAETRAHFSAAGDLSYDSSTGVFSVTTYKTTDFNNDFATRTTDSLAEGSNLYYTDSRVQTKLANISGDLIPDSNEAYDIGSPTKKFRTLYLSGSTIVLGNLTITDSLGTFVVRESDGTIAPFDLSNNTTSTLAEGSNLYYTRDRFDSALGDTTSISTIRGYFSSGGDISYDSATGTFSIDVEEIYTADNFDSDLDAAISGGVGLTYDSATNTVNIDDTGVVAGSYGSASLIPIFSVNAQGQIDSINEVSVAGVTNFVYDSATGLLTISTADGATFSDSINLSAFTTSTLAEGSNLYYTRDRFDSALGDATSISTIRSYFSSGGDITYDSATGQFSIDVEVVYTADNFDSDLDAAISGGTGLTYDSDTNTVNIDNTGVVAGTYGSASLIPIFSVNAQGQLDSVTEVSVAGVTNFVYDSATGLLTISTADGATFSDSINLSAFSTSTLAEGSNLYYTKVRVDSDVAQGFTDRTTDDLAEGDNLYYTRARFDSALGDTTSITTIRGYFSAAGDLSYDSATGTFSFDVEQVYTKENFDSDFNVALDEAALGGIGLAYNSTTNTLSIDSAELAAYFSTDDITEGSNLYYTTLRADSDARYAISVSDLGGDGSLTYSASTGVISYTGPSAAEVRAHFSGGANVIYDSTTGVFTLDSDVTITGDLTARQFLSANTQLAKPSKGDYSGERVRLYDFDDVNKVNYAIGVEASHIWFSVDTNLQGQGFKWYGDSVQIARLNAIGDFEIVGDFTAATLTGKYLGFDSDFGDKTTTNLTEGSNLYYTTARADSDAKNAVSAGTGVIYNNATGVIAIGQAVDSNADVYFDQLTIGTSLVVEGDFQVNGTQTIINTQTLSVTDNMIYLNSGESDGSPTQFIDIGFAGNYNDVGSYAHAGLFRDATDGVWKFYENYAPEPDSSPQIDVTHPSFRFASLRVSDIQGIYLGFDSDLGTKTTDDLTEGSNLYYTQDRFDSAFGDKTTSDLTEGSNLYYTTNRADSDARHAISVSDLGGDGSLTYSAATGVITYTGPSAAEVRAHFVGGSNIGYDSSTGVFDLDNTVTITGDFSAATLTGKYLGFDSDFGDQTTDDLTEGSNLYYTTARADSDFDVRLATKTTTDLTEGSNLYYTRDRFDSALGDTTSIGTIRGYFSAAGDLSYDSATGVFSFDVEQVYTKNNFDSDFNVALDEAALGGIGLNYNSTTNTLNIDSAELAAYFSTDDITEGSNLYYTTNRADSDFDVRLATKSTDDLTEGDNLYYTRDRFDSALGDATSISTIRGYFSAAGDLTYDSATGQFSFDVEQVYTKNNFDSDFNAALDEAALNGTGLSYDSATNTLSITNTGVVAGTYGSQSLIPIISVNAQGQIDSIGTALVAGVTGFSYDSASGLLSISTADGSTFSDSINLNPFTTTDLAEGSNLYYTTNRADSDFDARLATKSTTDLAEGDNLYYLTSRFDSDFGDQTTDDLTEGSNLYYTRGRFDSALGDATSISTIRGYFSSGGDITYDSATGQFSIDVEVVYTADNFDSDLDAAVSGGVGISYDTNTNAISIDSAELGSFFAAGTDRLGVAQFDSDQFTVTAGYVSINVIDGGSF